MICYRVGSVIGSTEEDKNERYTTRDKNEVREQFEQLYG